MMPYITKVLILFLSKTEISVDNINYLDKDRDNWSKNHIDTYNIII